MRIRYTPQARADLNAIFSHVSQDNPRAASHLIARIRQAIAVLSTHPSRGRSGRVSGTRELIIGGYPYIAVYRFHRNALEVLAIIHTARRWPEVL